MKLVIIGGAGVRTVFFAHGVAVSAKQANIDKLVLFDIDQKRLDIIGPLAAYVARKSNPDLEVSYTCDEVEALTGADYIVTTIRVGGDNSRTTDETIALKHGVIGQETTGVGGFSMSMRTIPAMLYYAKKAAQLCPNAIIFNFSNPSGIVTQALCDAGYKNVIGICDAPSSTKLEMCKALNVSPADLNVKFYGLNHLSWVTSVVLDGKEILHELVADKAFLSKVKEFNMFDPELIKIMGHLPNEYLYYFYYPDQALKNISATSTPRGKMIEQNNKEMFLALEKFDTKNKDELEPMLLTYLKFMHKRESSYMSVETGGKTGGKEFDGKMPNVDGYAGVMLSYLKALRGGTPHEMVVSIPAGRVDFGMNPTDVVETTCMVDKNGLNICDCGDLKDSSKALMNTIKAYERLTVLAAVARSKDLAIEALTIHPLVQSYAKAKAIVDDLGAAIPGMFM